MIVKRWLARPRWEHRDASVRRDAVAHGDLELLKSQLPTIAREDDDAAVRIAAIQRTADLALAQERSRDDPDATVKSAARELYLGLLSGRHPASPALADRLRLLRAIDDGAVWLHLLREGAEPELRQAALDRDPRAGWLMERILQDPDPELRMRLLSRIDDADAMQRIADQSRRRDKRLHRAARERSHAMRIAAGDREALAAASERICRRLELEAHKTQISADTLAEIDHAWHGLADQVASAMQTRYTHARAQYQAAIAAAAGPVSPAPPTPMRPNAEPESIHPSAGVDAAAAEVQRLAAEARFKASIASTINQARPRPKPNPARDAGIEHRLLQLEQALDRGELRAVLGIQQSLADSRIDNGALSRRFHDASVRSAELQRWQQWSTRRQRRQLCTDALALRDSGLHPDALTTRVRELRAEWTKLDELNIDTGAQTTTDAGLHKRFHGLCHRALAPAKAYFEHRDAMRRQTGDDIRTLIDNATGLDADSGDWAAMGALRKQLAAARRQLGDTEPRHRNQLADTLQNTLDALDRRLASHHAEVEAARQRLISEAGETSALEPPQRARRVRELQARWKQLGAGRADLDRKQWKVFRGICDGVFADLDQRRQQDAAEREQSIEQARQTVAEMAAIEASSIDTARRQHRELDARWRKLNVRDPELQKQWRAAAASLEQSLVELRQRARRAQFECVPEILAGAESSAALAAELRTALAGRPTSTADAGAARDVLVRLEALAGIDSPESDQDRRVALRLQRLQAVLGKGQRRDTRSEFLQSLAAWIGLGPLADDESELELRFRHAFKAVLNKL